MGVGEYWLVLRLTVSTECENRTDKPNKICHGEWKHSSGRKCLAILAAWLSAAELIPWGVETLVKAVTAYRRVQYPPACGEEQSQIVELRTLWHIRWPDLDMCKSTVSPLSLSQGHRFLLLILCGASALSFSLPPTPSLIPACHQTPTRDIMTSSRAPGPHSSRVPHGPVSEDQRCTPT